MEIYNVSDSNFAASLISNANLYADSMEEVHAYLKRFSIRLVFWRKKFLFVLPDARLALFVIAEDQLAKFLREYIASEVMES